MEANNGCCEEPCRRPTGLTDDVFGVLREEPRRYALYFLLEYETVSIDELADVVAGWRRVDGFGIVDRSERDAVHTALLHRHLPTMAAAELLTVDSEMGTVTRTNWPTDVREFVELAHDAETGVNTV